MVAPTRRSFAFRRKSPSAKSLIPAASARIWTSCQNGQSVISRWHEQANTSICPARFVPETSLTVAISGCAPRSAVRRVESEKGEQATSTYDRRGTPSSPGIVRSNEDRNARYRLQGSVPLSGPEVPSTASHHLRAIRVRPNGLVKSVDVLKSHDGMEPRVGPC